MSIMPDIKAPIALTHATIEKMSRHELLKWVNTIVHGEYKKIEELCSGVAYCQMMELLFPQSVCMKKVKLNPKLEHEYLHNLKQFQMAFTRINYEKSVPIERLMKGRFQDNFEFLQWFKKFFDVHAAGKENLAGIVSSKQSMKGSVRKSIVTPPLKKAEKQNKVTATREEADSTKADSTPPPTVSPNSLLVLQETRNQLLEQMKDVEHERSFYRSKLTSIEKTLNTLLSQNESTDWCKRCLNILYATDDGGSPQNKVALAVDSAEL